MYRYVVDSTSTREVVHDVPVRCVAATRVERDRFRNGGRSNGDAMTDIDSFNKIDHSVVDGGGHSLRIGSNPS